MLQVHLYFNKVHAAAHTLDPRRRIVAWVEGLSCHPGPGPRCPGNEQSESFFGTSMIPQDFSIFCKGGSVSSEHLVRRWQDRP